VLSNLGYVLDRWGVTSSEHVRERVRPRRERRPVGTLFAYATSQDGPDLRRRVLDEVRLDR